MVTSVRGIVAGVMGMAVGLTAFPAFAQSNLDAGKSPAQIFAHTCNACHRSPREIKRTSVAFMREHYTTGMQEAATMAAYLNSMGTDPKAVETRRKPVLGAGREPTPAEPKAVAGEAQAAVAAAANGKSAPGRPIPPSGGEFRGRGDARRLVHGRGAACAAAGSHRSSRSSRVFRVRRVAA